jgi:two-component system KDP operon response regulator KdpE
VAKIALVTGASRGIGRAIAQRLARDGFTVWAGYAGNREAAESLEVVQVSDFKLDPQSRQVLKPPEKGIRLTNLEFRLLYLLMKNPGRILEAEFIVDRVWGYHGEGNSHLLKNLVYRLRRKIEPDPNSTSHILTEPGMGYRFQP